MNTAKAINPADLPPFIEQEKLIESYLESEQYDQAVQSISDALEYVFSEKGLHDSTVYKPGYLITRNLTIRGNQQSPIYPQLMPIVNRYRNEVMTMLIPQAGNETYSLKRMLMIELVAQLNKYLESYRNIALAKALADSATDFKDFSSDFSHSLDENGAYPLLQRYLGKDALEHRFDYDLKLAIETSDEANQYSGRRREMFMGAAKLTLSQAVNIIKYLENTGDTKLAKKLKSRLIAEWNGPEAAELLGPLSGNEASPTGISNVAVKTSTAGSCPSNLRHLAGKIPNYSSALLGNVRQAMLDLNVAAEVARAKAQGVSRQQFVSSLQTTASSMANDALNSANIASDFSTSLSAGTVMQKARNGQYPANLQCDGAISAVDSAICNTINLLIGEMGNLEVAKLAANCW
ncbi:hypothetical protein [Methylomonas koyamae]|uniref:hypothetical protein n=1 Tax=Methylomonas koyamae TaxID=702114 RepID=UPI00112A838A|nr:hypothetical protein [Methylomonas koyamae]TPQ26890.1 hypothetical protein C2U68_09370 [Methylomonas koyamae]